MTRPYRFCFIKKIPALLFIFLAVGLLGLVSVSCGGNETDPSDTSDIKKYDRSKKAGSQDDDTGDVKEKISNEQVRDAMRMLKKVSLSPKEIRADSPVTIEVETAAPLEDNQYLAYVYWKNGRPLEETEEAKLPALSLKKHDVLFADVMLYENDQVISKKRTGTFMVLNSPPIIDEVTIPDIKGPGTYQFIVKAHDVDNDQMAFSFGKDEPVKKDENTENTENIEDTSGPASRTSRTSSTPASPFDGQIDTATGTVTWVLDQNLPDSITFTIVANDGDEGITKKIINMRFFKRPVREQ